MSEALDAPLIAQNYSRLVIDCQSGSRTVTSIPEVSEWVTIPGNLNAGQRKSRAPRRDLDPYHERIQLSSTSASGGAPDVFWSRSTP